MVLVANKVDLVHLRKVNTEQGQEMAAKHNVSMRFPQMLQLQPFSPESEDFNVRLQLSSRQLAMKILVTQDGPFSLKMSQV